MRTRERRGDKKPRAMTSGVPSPASRVRGSECADQAMIGQASVGGSLFLKFLQPSEGQEAIYEPCNQLSSAATYSVGTGKLNSREGRSRLRRTVNHHHLSRDNHHLYPRGLGFWRSRSKELGSQPMMSTDKKTFAALSQRNRIVFSVCHCFSKSGRCTNMSLNLVLQLFTRTYAAAGLRRSPPASGNPKTANLWLRSHPQVPMFRPIWLVVGGEMEGGGAWRSLGACPMHAMARTWHVERVSPPIHKPFSHRNTTCTTRNSTDAPSVPLQGEGTN